MRFLVVFITLFFLASCSTAKKENVEVRYLNESEVSHVLKLLGELAQEPKGKTSEFVGVWSGQLSTLSEKDLWNKGHQITH